MAQVDTPEILDQSAQKACRSRLMALRSMLPPQGTDALLVSRPHDIEYLTGFSGHDSWLLVTADDAIIISDNRYEEGLAPHDGNGLTSVIIGVRHRLHLALQDRLAAASVRQLGIQADHLTVASRNTIEGAISCGLVETTGLVGVLRRRKDESEIGAIERAIRVNEEALRATLPQIKIGMTERELSALLEHEMKRRGGRRGRLHAHHRNRTTRLFAAL